MEVHKTFSLIFEILLALVIISEVFSKNISGLLVNNKKSKDFYETANKYNDPDGESIHGRNRNFISQRYSPSVKGDCIPVPPPPNGTDDSNVPIHRRLAYGVANMTKNRLDKGVDDQGIFVLGNTGSGKSTVALLLAGNLSRIHATVTPRGEVVIFDEDGKTGLPSFRSKTLLPEYIVNNETGTVVVDCPGFDDNRGTDLDIAAMYFLKDALDNASHAKFLFTVEFSAVKPGNDRLSFDQLISHATSLIFNPKEKKSAFGLIVTKVPRFNEYGQLRTREELLTGFKDFILAYIDVKKDDLEYAMYPEEKEKIQRKIDLSEIFLSDLGADGLPTRISCFRSPEDCGALDELPEMLETKEMLTDLYRDVICYTDVTPHDFTVTLKTETLLNIIHQHVPDTLDHIKNQTEQGIRKLELNFFEKFYIEIKDALYPSQVFIRAVERINWNMENIPTNESEFSSYLYNIFIDLNMDLKDAQDITNEIQELDNQLRFYEMVTGYNIPRPIRSWLLSLESMATEFADYIEYYDFYEKLELELDTYSKQVMLEILKRNEGGVEFETDEVLDFLSMNAIASVPDHIRNLFLFNMGIEDRKCLADMVKAHIPNVTLTCTFSTDQQSYTLTVTGRNVKISDIIRGPSNLPPPHVWPGQCSDNSVVKQISIFAQDLVYFDAVLNLDCNDIRVSVLASEWEVIGETRIQLGRGRFSSKCSSNQTKNAIQDQVTNKTNLTSFVCFHCT